MARLDLTEPYAIRQARESIRDSLRSHGEECVLLHMHHVNEAQDVVPRCPDCYDDVYKQGERYDCSRCFAPGTLVRTYTGYRPIEEIQVGDLVLTEDGGYHRVTQTMANPFEGTAYQWRSSMMTRPVISTGNHPVWAMASDHQHADKSAMSDAGEPYCSPYPCEVFISNARRRAQLVSGVRRTKSGRWTAKVTIGHRQQKHLGTFDDQGSAEAAVLSYKADSLDLNHFMQWREVSELNDRSWVGTRVPVGEADHTFVTVPDVFIGNPGSSGPERRGPRRFELTEDFLWMIGLYLAEGSAGKRSISFSLHRKEQDYQQRLLHMFSEWGYSSRLSKGNGDEVSVVVHSSVLAEWFPAWLGSGCAEKAIPEELVELPAKRAMCIVQGVWDGDGTKSTTEIGQTSEILALQLAEILQRAGLQPTQRHLTSRALSNGRARKPAYITGWKSEDGRAHRKRRWLFSPTGEELARIIHHQAIPYKGMVYNLEVEDNHTYVVQNTLVHNCYGTTFDGGIAQAYRAWGLFTDAQDAETFGKRGMWHPIASSIQTEHLPDLWQRDYVIRVGRWSVDHRVEEVVGIYVFKQVANESLRTGGMRGQTLYDTIAQRADIQLIAENMPIHQYPIKGVRFDRFDGKDR